MPSGRPKVRELKWPRQGVVRRTGLEPTAAFTEPYPSPYAINCRSEDPIAKRLRGGSRPGLTEYADDLDGATISAMVSVPTVSTSGTASKLAVIADSALGILEDGVYSAPSGALLTEDSDTLVTEGGDTLLAGTGDVPASCHLCARGRVAYAVASSGIVSLDLSTGVVDTLAARSGKGTVPSSVTHGCVYRDRLVLAGADNAIYMSRQGDPTDWDYGADVDDSGRALVFQLGEAAEIGDTCTALVPFQDAALLAATHWGLWTVQGDPATGTLRNVSRGVGIIRPQAWCIVADARVGDMPVRSAVVFLSEAGLFMVSPSGDGLQSLSEDRLPEDLLNIANTTAVSLVYAPKERGVYVFVTPTSGGATHYFFDLFNKGFWPVRLPTVQQPLAACWHDGDVLLAGSDGMVRSVGGDDDDGTAIASHVLIGPLRLGAPNTHGILSSIHGMIGTGSGSVYWRVIPGRTAEEACANGKAAIDAYVAGNVATAEGYAAASGTWTAGRSTTRYPRVRSMWMCLWLRAAAPWAYEGVTIESSEAGRWR